VLNFITYIRYKLCRYTLKGEKSILKGEGSIRKYVTFCSYFSYSTNIIILEQLKQAKRLVSQQNIYIAKCIKVLNVV